MLALDRYTIDTSSSLLSAMKKIDNNQKGFLVVLDNEKVVGTLTDGDIRRAILSTEDFNLNLAKVYTSQFQWISVTDDFSSVVTLFKDIKVKFLPIVDEEMHLCNIITKANLHVLILQDIPYSPTYPFAELDDTVLEHEIFPRPWGYYKTAFLNQYCQCKMIHVNPLGKLSLQKHLQRDEYWTIVHGVGSVYVGDKIYEVKAGDSFIIPRNTLHRLINTSENDALIITEIQFGEYFGEDDILRFEDEYGRCKNC